MKICLENFKGKKIAAAVSGGRDSMALLYYLFRHREEGGYSLCAVHCEHGIRGAESKRDEQFVRSYCEERGIPVFVFREDCPRLAKAEKKSLETVAREFRYRAFDSLLQEGKADLIATAHHREDNAETVLFRLCRGSSLAGLCGISERPGFVRPLLHCSRAEIDAYLFKEGIPYREDSTNADSEYTRNFLRKEIFPRLEERIPGTTDAIDRFSLVAEEDERLLKELSLPLVAKNAVLLDERFPLFSRACLVVLKEMGVEVDYTFTHLRDLYDLQKKENGKRICLPCGVTAYREYDRIFFQKGGKESIEIPFEEVELCLAEGTEKKGVFDGDRIPKGAVLRTRRNGDRFRPYGGGEKSLGDWFTDKKIPLREREAILLVAKDSEVLIVVGYEISDRVKVTAETKRICRIKYR